jgi:hypothetical protein
MSTKKANKNEVTVLSVEQIENFPKDVKKDIIFLQDSVQPGELAEFNPIVADLLLLEERGKKIKLISADEEGKYNKENIQDFVDLKKDIRTYRALVKEIAKKLKAPRTLENKALIKIEKTFVNMATDVYDIAEKEFSTYVKEELAKKEERQKKKDAELLEAVKEANEAAAAANKKNEVSQIFNKLRFELISKITENASEEVHSSSLERLTQYKCELVALNVETLSKDVDSSVLDETMIAEIDVALKSTIKTALMIVDNKISLFEVEKESIVREAVENSKKEVVKEDEVVVVEEIKAVPLPPPAAPLNIMRAPVNGEVSRAEPEMENVIYHLNQAEKILVQILIDDAGDLNAAWAQKRVIDLLSGLKEE